MQNYLAKNIYLLPKGIIYIFSPGLLNNLFIHNGRLNYLFVTKNLKSKY